MDELEKLQIKLKKIEEFHKALPDRELYDDNGGTHSVLVRVINKEREKVKFDS